MVKAWEAQTKGVGFLSRILSFKAALSINSQASVISLYPLLPAMCLAVIGDQEKLLVSLDGGLDYLLPKESEAERTKYVPDSPSCFLRCCHRKGHIQALSVPSYTTSFHGRGYGKDRVGCREGYRLDIL